MQKKGSSRILSVAALLLLIFSAFACKKPAHIGKLDSSEEFLPIVLATSLSDTLPQKTLDEFNLRDAHGVKIAFIDGTYVSYFEYKAEPHKVIRAISNLAFSKASILADTTCRRISYKNLELLKSQLPVTEINHSDFFWNSDNGMEAFECIKPPFKHTLIVDKNSIRIFHRIEFLG